MTQTTLQKLTGVLFILSAVGFAVTSTVLSSTFNWPDILREPPDTVLTEFQEGGTRLIWTWFAVAWSYFLLIVPILLLGRVLGREDTPYLGAATFIGAVSVVACLVGFLRWVFVVPSLAAMYADPSAYATTPEAVIAAYSAQHQFGGALLGEHVGQTLAVLWTVAVSLSMLRSPLVRPWLGWLGLAAGATFLLNQGDVLATAVPGFPVWDLGGLLGSVLWALWLVALGVSLVWSARRVPQRRAVAGPVAPAAPAVS
jgi:hypothetical protein